MAAHVQSGMWAFLGTPELVVTLSAGTQAGNGIALFIGCTDQPTSSLDITDDQGNTYIQGHAFTGGTGPCVAVMYYVLNAIAGTQNITVTAPGNEFGFCIAHEFSGADTFIDSAMNAQAAPGTGTDATTSGAITTTGTDVYIFGGSLADSITGSVTAAGTGFTLGNQPNDNGVRGASEYQIQSAGGSIAATFTSSVDEPHISGIMAFGLSATDKAIWELPELTAAALADLLVAVDDPSGTPATLKLALSAFAALTVSDVVVQTKTVGSGTYTPTTGMKKVLVIGVGGGGSGAGGVNTDSAGGGGGGGGTCIRLLTAAQIGASKDYVVGAAGAATTLDSGTLLNAGAGGNGTAGSQAGGLGGSAVGGTGGAAANGDLNIPGTPGSTGTTFSGTNGMGGTGGSSVFGFGANTGGVNLAGVIGQAYGGGGSGGHASGTPNRDGGAGADGILYLIEFIG